MTGPCPYQRRHPTDPKDTGTLCGPGAWWRRWATSSFAARCLHSAHLPRCLLRRSSPPGPLGAMTGRPLNCRRLAAFRREKVTATPLRGVTAKCRRRCIVRRPGPICTLRPWGPAAVRVWALTNLAPLVHWRGAATPRIILVALHTTIHSMLVVEGEDLVVSRWSTKMGEVLLLQILPCFMPVPLLRPLGSGCG